MNYVYRQQRHKKLVLRSPPLKYPNNSYTDLEVALQIKASEIDRLVTEITDLEENVRQLRTQLIKAIKDEKWMLESHCRQFVSRSTDE